MAKTIWKFPLETKTDQLVSMPKGAKILTVQKQFSEVCLWAMVDPNAPKEARAIEIIGTGHEIYEDMGVERQYIGTIQIDEFVFHVFERLN